MMQRIGAFSVELASVPDREDLVAEVWLGRELVAEVRREHTGIHVEIYAPHGGSWGASYDELLEVLRHARLRLDAA